MAKKILIIANKIVFPSLDGGSLAIQRLVTTLLKQGYMIDIICITKDKNNLPAPKKDQTIKNIRQVIFKKKMNFNLILFLKSIIKQNSYQALRFYDLSIQKKIQQLVDEQEYKAIIFESVFTGVYLQYLRLDRIDKVIFRAHNIEYKIWEDLARNAILKKNIFLLLASQVRRLENQIPKYVDYIFTLSQNDQEYFKNIYPHKTHNIPVTFEVENIKNKKIKNSIAHLGAMDWRPNIEGINWFLEKVKPEIEEEDVKIYIAGKNMPEKFFKYRDSRTKIEGKVDDAKEYIINKEIIFVPLFSGSGIRIKILEAMALGIPVISTSKGAKGIPCQNKKNILIANTPTEFKNAISLLLKNKRLAKKIGNEGKKLISNHFSNDIVSNKISEIL